MKYLALVVVVSLWPSLSLSREWYESRCELALELVQSQNTCTDARILCLVNGVNAPATSQEKVGCIATSIKRSQSEYRTPIPARYLKSPDQVIAAGSCDRENAFALLFGKEHPLMGNLPLLLAFRNTSEAPAERRIHVLHDETSSFESIRRTAAIFGLIVSK